MQRYRACPSIADQTPRCPSCQGTSIGGTCQGRVSGPNLTAPVTPLAEGPATPCSPSGPHSRPQERGQRCLYKDRAAHAAPHPAAHLAGSPSHDLWVPIPVHVGTGGRGLSLGDPGPAEGLWPMSWHRQGPLPRGHRQRPPPPGTAEEATSTSRCRRVGGPWRRRRHLPRPHHCSA